MNGAWFSTAEGLLCRRRSEATGSELRQKEGLSLVHLGHRLLTTAGEAASDSHKILFRLTDGPTTGVQDAEPSITL